MMGRSLVIWPTAVSIAAIAFPGASAAQNGVSDGEWHVYGGDPGHTRYSSLDQINADNAEDLEVVWRFNGRNFGPNPFAQSETTPLYVDGVLYATIGQDRSVVAIDPGTGELLWSWRNPESDERLEDAPRRNAGRGVAYWTDRRGDDRIIVFTPGYQLAALDAHTGYPVQEFGGDGMVDLFDDHRTREGVALTGSIGSSSPVAVVGDILVVGSAQHVGLRPPSMVNTPGDVLGIDARTGALVWTFKTIPEPGEEGNETWLEDSWRYTGNAGVWAQMSWDAELGYVYLPVEVGTGDYYGGHRHGNNLFSTSIVALDARTGRRVWHFQTIHHDIWDWDNPTAPILADVTIDGQQRRILAQLSKQGFVYVLDRVTGEPIWPIEERPVPQGDVPGEWYSLTQPFPTKPAPYERQGFSEDDLIDFTPEILARAKEIAGQFRWGPIFSPPSLADAADGTQGMLGLPAATGGSNWEGGALDPVSDYLYVPSVTQPTVRSLVPGGSSFDMRYVAGGGRSQIAPGVSVVKPPWGRITAIDLKTGEHVWVKPNGDTPAYVAERLGIDPSLVQPPTGRQSRAGLVVTATVLIAGEGQNGGPNLWVLDKATGQRIARIDLPGTQVGLPMTYMHQGRQYVVMSVSESGQPAEIVALALPE